LHYLAEDPWPLAGFFALVGVVCLVPLYLTQQGKYLVRALIAFGLALVVLGVEHFWVTDAERVEATVRDLVRAVGRSDVDGALALMTADVTLDVGDRSINEERAKVLGGRIVKKAGVVQGAVVRGLLGSAIAATKFDLLTVSRLEARVGVQSRQGKADFRVHAAGTTEATGVNYNFATDPNGTDWSVQLREEGGRWKVESIVATRLPAGVRLPIGGPGR